MADKITYVKSDGSTTEIVSIKRLKSILAQYGLTKVQEQLSNEGEMETEKIDLTPKAINPALVLQDPTHRFVTDKQIELWRSKPTLHEIRDLVAETKDGLETSINDIYYRLLNMPDAIHRIKKLSRILQNDDTLSELFKLLDDTISVEDLEEHEKNNMHITNVDRKNLQLLQKIIDDGVIETIEKIDLEQLAKPEVDKNTDDAVSAEHKSPIPGVITIGYCDQCDPEDCDIYFKEQSETDLIQHLVFPNLESKIQFTGGEFACDEFKLDNGNNNVIEGIGDGTSILVTKKFFTKKVACRDFMIYSTSAVDKKLICGIDDDSKFDNVTFANCQFVLRGTNIRFTNCTFKYCAWDYVSARNIIITNNFFQGTKLPDFICASLMCNNNLS